MRMQEFLLVSKKCIKKKKARKVVVVLNMDLSIQQIAEGIPKSILNASDKELENFQKIIEETIKLREGHRNLQRMIKSFSSSMIQRS